MAVDKNPPAFQFYPKDFLSDANVVAMSNEALGAYIRLLCHCWIEGSLPTDEKILAKLSQLFQRWGHNRETVIRLFQKTGDDRYEHKRLNEERVRQLENIEKRKKAAEERWKKEHANALQTQCPSSSSSSSSACTNIKNTPYSCPEPDSAGSRTPADADGPVVLTFPTKGQVKSWDLREAKVREYEECYPDMDIPFECRKALQWCADNPKKTKDRQWNDEILKWVDGKSAK